MLTISKEVFGSGAVILWPECVGVYCLLTLALQKANNQTFILASKDTYTLTPITLFFLFPNTLCQVLRSPLKNHFLVFSKGNDVGWPS